MLDQKGTRRGSERFFDDSRGATAISNEMFNQERSGRDLEEVLMLAEDQERFRMKCLTRRGAEEI
jgi:hypothetical protein